MKANLDLIEKGVGMHKSSVLILYSTWRFKQRPVFNILIASAICVVAACESSENPPKSLKNKVTPNVMALYVNTCIACHAGGLLGRAPSDRRMNPLNWDVKQDRLRQVLTAHPGYGGSKFSDSDIKSLSRDLTEYQTEQTEGPEK